jgi:hypothetical protein
MVYYASESRLCNARLSIPTRKEGISNISVHFLLILSQLVCVCAYIEVSIKLGLI